MLQIEQKPGMWLIISGCIGQMKTGLLPIISSLTASADVDCFRISRRCRVVSFMRFIALPGFIDLVHNHFNAQHLTLLQGAGKVYAIPLTTS